MPEFHQRIKILQQLGYVNEDRGVTLKGRVTCEINSTQVSEMELAKDQAEKDLNNSWICAYEG